MPGPDRHEHMRRTYHQRKVAAAARFCYLPSAARTQPAAETLPAAVAVEHLASSSVPESAPAVHSVAAVPQAAAVQSLLAVAATPESESAATQTHP